MSDGIDALCRALIDVGIDCVFGVPGTQNVALFEGFRRHGLRTVLASHELAAAFMANGYFRASGRVAALATIPGPGFTYALTGLAEARHDSAGVLFLVGAPASGPGHAFRLQALDQRAIAAPVVKLCLTIASSADVERIVADAYAAASEGEPGPVMVELAMDALGVEREPAPSTGAPSRHSSPDVARGELARRFAQASRPLLLLGQGAFAAAEPLRALAEALTIPILTTPTARGIVPEDHELVLGFDPLRGHIASLNAFVDRADLVIALGCKLGHNGTAGFQLRLPPDRLIQVDADRAVVGASYPAQVGITARVEDVVDELQVRRQPSQWSRAEIGAARDTVRAAAPDAVEPTIRGFGTPREFLAWLRGLLPRDAIIVTDSGLHQILVRRHLDVLSPRGLIVPTDFQSMGFGLPASIGARIAAPGRAVVAVVGDGGFLMSGLELLTMRRERLPIVTFVFNDGHLNQIRLQQLGSYGHAHAVDLVNPDFAQLASALGVGYLRIGDASDDDVRRALRGDRPTLVEVVVGDSVPMRALPHITRTKRLARALLGSRGRDWIKRRWQRRPDA